MLKVSQLFIYPVKSLAGIAVNSAMVTIRGFQGDRRYMIVDEKNKFLTIREYPKMTRIQPELTEEGIVLKSLDQNLSSCLVVEPKTNISEEVKIWNAKVKAQYVSKEVDSWLSNALGTQVKMVFMPEESLRPVDTTSGFHPEGKFVSFADAYPFMLMGDASIKDLNERTTSKEKFTVKRFRPNILFSGGRPNQEDDISNFTINGVQFKGLEKCARCTIPNVDPENGIINEHTEPLATLAKYRLQNRKINFGLNVVHSGTGVIHVGDELKLG